MLADLAWLNSIMQVHIIVGTAQFDSGIPSNMTGMMADVAASPSDPMFINHHVMVDCILKEWFQRNRDAEYPQEVSLQGHRKDDYIVPFFTNGDIFKTADNFGYSCELPDITVPGGGSPSTAVTLPWLFLIVMGSIV